MRNSLTITILLACLAIPARAETITVAAAISMKEAMTEIAADYQKTSGDQVQPSFGASGTLAAQITQGAPVDVFISAGVKEMDQLASQDLIDKSSRRVVCGNRLVLIVSIYSSFDLRSFEALTSNQVTRIAIGQPNTVPAGQYAWEVFEKLKLIDALRPKLVYGENVRQVLDYVSRGDATAGVVYATDAAAGPLPAKVAAIADESLHSPIVYPAAIIKSTIKSAAAQHFLDYLSSTAARQRLQSRGFLINSPTTAPATAP